MSKWLLAGGFGLTLVIVSVIALGREGPSEQDFWVHPRGEAFDPELHYKAGSGEIFYKAENDIERAIGGVIIDHSRGPRITVDLGADLFSVPAHSQGSLRPVLLYDSSGDGVVDRSLRGRIEGAQAVFDDPQLSEIEHGRTYWQIGIR